jgi:hypothetical protein
MNIMLSIAVSRLPDCRNPNNAIVSQNCIFLQFLNNHLHSRICLITVFSIAGDEKRLRKRAQNYAYSVGLDLSMGMGIIFGFWVLGFGFGFGHSGDGVGHR